MQSSDFRQGRALMLNKTFLENINKERTAYRAERREVIKLSGDALNASKRAIFALHRDDMEQGEALLKEAGDLFLSVRELTEKTPRLADEGSYKAGLEEFVEASLYHQYVTTGKVDAVDFPDVRNDIYLGGLADLSGELQRRQVKAATKGNIEEVQKIKDAIEEIVSSLLAMDLDGYLRTKFDQTKNSLRRAEDILYEVTLKRS